MNSEILKRVVRAIADGSQGDLEQLAQTIVKSERQIGHTRLADELETILARSRPTRTRNASASEVARTLSDLPTSRRHGESLLTLLPRESLEHHMVLPREVDTRFARIEQEYAARERLGAYGLRPRKTVLLYGPPSSLRSAISPFARKRKSTQARVDRARGNSSGSNQSSYRQHRDECFRDNSVRCENARD